MGFTASQNTVAAGAPVTLSWTLANDSYDYIDVVGPVRGGSQVVSPMATTTFGRSTMAVTVRAIGFGILEPRRAAKMCRNIKILFNFDPPVTADEVHSASLQYVRKISGFNKPSKANEPAFLAAVNDIAAISMQLLNSLESNAQPRNREEEAAKARARNAQRFPA